VQEEGGGGEGCEAVNASDYFIKHPTVPRAHIAVDGIDCRLEEHCNASV
jgi:hypothetical protein